MVIINIIIAGGSTSLIVNVGIHLGHSMIEGRHMIKDGHMIEDWHMIEDRRLIENKCTIDGMHRTFKIEVYDIQTDVVTLYM